MRKEKGVEVGAGITRAEMAEGGLMWYSKRCCRTEWYLVLDKQVQEEMAKPGAAAAMPLQQQLAP